MDSFDDLLPPDLPYQVLQGSGYLLMIITDQLNGQVASFVAEADNLTASKLKEPVIINCLEVSSLTEPAVKALMDFQARLLAQHRAIRILIGNDALLAAQRTYLQSGQMLESVDLYAALTDLGCVKNTEASKDFTLTLAESLLNAMQIQAKSPTTIGEIDCSAKESKLFDYSATIDIESKSFSGLVVLSIPEMALIQLVSQMTKKSLNQITPEIENGVAELLNITVGAAKRALNLRGYSVVVSSLPVYYPPEFRGALAYTDDFSLAVVPATIAAGEMVLEIRLIRHV